MRRNDFRNYGQRNSKCREIGTVGEYLSVVCTEPVETVLKFREGEEMKVTISGHKFGKSGGGLTQEDLLTAKEKALRFLLAAAENKGNPADLADHLRRISLVPFVGSPPLFMMPHDIIIRKS